MTEGGHSFSERGEPKISTVSGLSQAPEAMGDSGCWPKTPRPQESAFPSAAPRRPPRPKESAGLRHHGSFSLRDLAVVRLWLPKGPVALWRLPFTAARLVCSSFQSASALLMRPGKTSHWRSPHEKLMRFSGRKAPKLPLVKASASSFSSLGIQAKFKKMFLAANCSASSIKTR